MKHSTIVAGAASLGTIFLAGSLALGQVQPQPQQQPPSQQRGPVGSDRSLVMADRRVVRIIHQLQRDQRDYGGYRVKAIQDLRQAEGDLKQALKYDRHTDTTQHP